MNLVLSVLLMAIVVVLLRNDPALVVFILICYLVWKWFKRNNFWAQKQAELMAQDLKVKKGIYQMLRSLDSQIALLVRVVEKKSRSNDEVAEYIAPVAEIDSESYSDNLL